MFAKGQELERIPVINMLGLRLNTKLQFGPQYDYIVTEITKKCGIVQRNLHHAPKQFSKILIRSFLHGTASHGLQYLPILPKKTAKSINIQVNNAVRKKFCTVLEREAHRSGTSHITQYDILQRSDIPSMENVVRMLQLCRLNKLAMTAEPAYEFEYLMECIGEIKSNRERSRLILPPLYARPNIHYNKPNDFFTTQPYGWIELYNKLPLIIRSKLGTAAFSNEVVSLYKGICQHDESRERLCSNCSTNTFDYANKYMTDNDLMSLKNIKITSKRTVQSVQNDILSKKNIFFSSLLILYTEVASVYGQNNV